MLTESFYVVSEKNPDWGLGKVVGMTMVKSSEALKDDNGLEVKNANGEIILVESSSPMNMVIWEDVSTPAPSFHEPSELSHVENFGNDDEDYDEDDENDELELSETSTPIIDTHVGTEENSVDEVEVVN